MSYWTCLLCICLGQLADYCSTRYAMSRGMVEYNPIVRAIGLMEAKVGLCIGMALIVYFLSDDRRLRIGMIGLVFGFGAALWNLYWTTR